jgi:CheY-like chemotaxis protein
MSKLESGSAFRRENWDRGRFDVLIVEDDAGSRDEYCEFLTTLGYRCHPAADGRKALEIIAINQSVGIVLTDLAMPALDGMSLLSELQARFTQFRPLVPIVVTGMATLETAVEAMRSDAIDFLPKPASPAMLSAAMRRASARWTMLHSQFRLLELMELGNGPSAKPRAAATFQPDSTKPDRESLQKFVRAILKSRQRRAEFMDVSKFADPAWDIMLDLTSAALEGRSVPAFSVGVAANVPMSTALRYVKRLAEDGTIKRWDDPDDKRRSLVALEDHALEKMISYLSSVWRSVVEDLMPAP